MESWQKILDVFGDVKKTKELETCLESMACANMRLSSAFKNYAEGAEIRFRNSEMSRRWTTLRNSIGDDLTGASKKLNNPEVKKFFEIEQFNIKDVLDKMNKDLLHSVDYLKIEFNSLQEVGC